MIEWCDQALYRTHWRYCLALSEEEYYAHCEEMGVPVAERGTPTSGACACVTPFRPPQFMGPKTMIVCILRWQDHSGIQIAGLLLHEAVHIVQIILHDIGEQHPSDEFQAYSIQTVAENLMEQFWRRVVWSTSAENLANS